MTSRSRFAALALWGVLGVGFVPLGCGTGEPDPVATARAFTQAVRARNVEAVLPLLEQGVVERIELAAERASDQVGGRRSVEPIEMLQIVHVDPTFEVAAAELVTSDGERARVRLESTDGRSHQLSLVMQDGAWRVVLPGPTDSDAPEVDPLAGGA